MSRSITKRSIRTQGSGVRDRAELSTDVILVCPGVLHMVMICKPIVKANPAPKYQEIMRLRIGAFSRELISLVSDKSELESAPPAPPLVASSIRRIRDMHSTRHIVS
jgi:hypothetical protein